MAVHVAKKVCRCLRAGFGEGTEGAGGQATRTTAPRMRVERTILIDDGALEAIRAIKVFASTRRSKQRALSNVRVGMGVKVRV